MITKSGYVLSIPTVFEASAQVREYRYKMFSKPRHNPERIGHIKSFHSSCDTTSLLQSLMKMAIKTL